MLKPVILLISIFLICTTYSVAQDSVLVPKKRHSPQRAILYSAVLPGLGQVYNRKAWKVPIVYGAGYLLVRAAVRNNTQYKDFLQAYKQRTDGNTATVDKYATTYSEQNLILIKDNFKRNRDISIIGLSAVYILTILDAYVDAQLYDFDVSDDLKASILPTQQLDIYGNSIPSLAFQLKF